MSRNVSRTATTTKDVSQWYLSDESYVLFTAFEPAETTQEETKELLYQGEFINYQLLLQHKY